MLVRLVGLAAGVEQKSIDAILTAYADQVTHAKYAKAALRESERRRLREDARRLKALGNLHSRE